jgi:hypothetical protein
MSIADATPENKVAFTQMTKLLEEFDLKFSEKNDECLRLTDQL